MPSGTCWRLWSTSGQLPQKIGATATQILQGITTAADKEAAAAQTHLAESVVEQAKKLSTKINYAALFPLGMAVLVLHDGIREPAFMGGLCLVTGLSLCIHAGKEFAEGGKGWWKRMPVASAMLVLSGVGFSLVV